jgi:hypothetical protein
MMLGPKALALNPYWRYFLEMSAAMLDAIELGVE